MKSFIQFLIEKRSNPGVNKKLTTYEELVKYSQNAGNLYISYTELEKIGINPMSTYQTPNGIYTYQLDYVLDSIKVSKDVTDVPFAGNQPFIWVIKPTKNVLVLQHYTEQELQQDINKLFKVFGDRIKEDVEFAKNRARKKIPGGMIWNITRVISKNPNNWNYILRHILGYNIIRDDGSGIIHPAEPHQTVFLSKDSFKPIEKIRNVRPKLDDYGVESVREYQSRISEFASQIVGLTNTYLKTGSLESFKNLIANINKKYSYNKFNIVKALGPKLWDKLKREVIDNKNPYFLTKLYYTLGSFDRDLVGAIKSDVKASLKYASYFHANRVESVEETISKSKDASIKYFLHIDQYIISQYTPLLLIDGDKHWKQICAYVISDEKILRSQIKKHGYDMFDRLYKKYSSLQIPSLEKIKKEKEDKIQEEFYPELDEFIQNPSVQKLAKLYGSMTSIGMKHMDSKKYDTLMETVVDNIKGDDAYYYITNLNKIVRYLNQPLGSRSLIKVMYYICKNIKHPDYNTGHQLRRLSEDIMTINLKKTNIDLENASEFKNDPDALAQLRSILNNIKDYEDGIPF